jgi:hypothetical protein
MAQTVHASRNVAFAEDAYIALAMPAHAATRFALADNTSIPLANDTVASGGVLTKNGGCVLVFGRYFDRVHIAVSFICVVLLLMYSV